MSHSYRVVTALEAVTISYNYIVSNKCSLISVDLSLIVLPSHVLCYNLVSSLREIVYEFVLDEKMRKNGPIFDVFNLFVRESALNW